MDTVTPAPILHPIAEPPSGLTPRVWARWFLALQAQAGTPGPAGPQGEQGEPGPAGPAGADATLGPTLTTIEALTGTLNTMIYFTGTDVAALSALSALARTLLAQSTTGAMQSTLGLGTAATQTYTEGTFTITGTGFVTPPSGTARYTRIGNYVAIRLPDLTGTSNAATFTLTGLPAALQTTQLHYVPIIVQDNTAVLNLGQANVSGATITLQRVIGGGAWTASGTKGVFSTVVSYLIL